VREMTQESLFFDPGLVVKWCRQRGLSQWKIQGTLEEDFERGEVMGAIPIGMTGEWCEAPKVVREALTRSGGQVTFQAEGNSISLKVDRVTSPLWVAWGAQGRWLWTRRAAVKAVETARGPVTVGPTLVYGRDRNPRTVRRTDPKHVARIRRAWGTVQAAWPE